MQEITRNCLSSPAHGLHLVKVNLALHDQGRSTYIHPYLETYSTEKVKLKHNTFVNKTFSKGENMIKLMGLKNEQFADKFESMMEGATVADLEKILHVRGNKKSEFPNLVKSL